MVKKKEEKKNTSTMSIWGDISLKAKALVMIFAVFLCLPLALSNPVIIFMSGFFDALILLQIIGEVRRG